MKEYEIKKLFINPFYKRSLIREIEIFSSDYDFSSGLSYSSWYNNCLFHQSRIFQPLVKKILNKISYNILITEMWGNINYPGSCTSLHNHGNKTHTGVIYIKKPRNSGNIIIDGKVIKVKENDLLLFNASKMHQTEINQSNKKRVVISFNYQVT